MRHFGPPQCERCGVFWRLDAAQWALEHRGGRLVCFNREACNGRVRVAQSLDRLVEQNRRRR